MSSFIKAGTPHTFFWRPTLMYIHRYVYVVWKVGSLSSKFFGDLQRQNFFCAVYLYTHICRQTGVALGEISRLIQCTCFWEWALPEDFGRLISSLLLFKLTKMLSKLSHYSRLVINSALVAFPLTFSVFFFLRYLKFRTQFEVTSAAQRLLE